MNLKIGVFDSGVGGLSVLKEIKDQNSEIPTIYLADQIHVPYGRRKIEEIKHFSEEITHFLTDKGANLVVVACNTASAASLNYLRKKFPQFPIVGMEPAIKPAAQISNTRVVGVLATPATFQGKLYHSLINKYGESLEILQNTCSGLVEQIESGYLEGEKTRDILESAIIPMLERNADAIVLGCTHYPFVTPLIRSIAGNSIKIIDPAPAVARRAISLFNDLPEQKKTNNQHDAASRFFTTGDEKVLQTQLAELLGLDAEVEKVHWSNSTIPRLE
jgi:glutamate racemase